MSALPIDREFLNLPQTAPVVSPRAVPAAKSTAKSRAIAQPRVTTAMLTRAATQFAFVAFCTWAISSLAGQVYVEKLRRDQIQAQIRTSAAVRSETALRVRLNDWMDSKKIAEWATMRGFVASGAPSPATQSAPATGGYYAFRQ